MPGQRVSVPFGTRTVTGIIITPATTTSLPAGKLKPITQLLDDAPALDQPLLDCYRWAADYYQCPPGLALQAGLPRQVRAGQPLEWQASAVWKATEQGIATDLASLARAPRQQQVLGFLCRQPGLEQKEISASLDYDCGAALRALQEKGLAHRVSAEPAPAAARQAEQPLTLNAGQNRAFTAVAGKLQGFHCHLLEGITGSGKTEIYLQLIAKVLASGRQVLVLIPEIGLTPQTLERFQNRFNCPVTTLHSGLSESSRFRAWLDARSGRARIIIGTRSAAFLPLLEPGLIIIDEEHDPSFKQQDGFRYSARDLAIYRARQLDIPVLLGSATPSLESLNNALAGRYHLHQLNDRAGAAVPPQFRFLDLRGEALHEGLGESLLDTLGQTLAKGEQALVFINRRGYSPMLMCHQCGWVAECQRCDMAYTLHRQPAALICHHCDGHRPLPDRCPDCAGTQLLPVGLGTERVEKLLTARFADYPVIRVDRDSTRTRDAMSNIMSKVNENRPCILVGTQMLAKGHHFPAVTLVAMLDIDRSLFSTSFRGQEQMGQLITQVAGRAGRGDRQGQVLIQSHHPDHPLLQMLVQQGYNALARHLLQERQNLGMPPFSYQALIHAEAATRSLPEDMLAVIARQLGDAGTDVNILGPLPSPMEKKSGRFRFQLILQAPSRSSLHKSVRQCVKLAEGHELSRRVRWSIDIDPLDFS